MIVVGSTMARYVTDREDSSLSWLKNAEAMREQSPEPLQFFAALEYDGADAEPFAAVTNRLMDLHGPDMGGGSKAWYWFRYNDGRTTVTTSNRLWKICAGRNIIQDYAMDIGASHILFLDADMEPPADCIGKLLALDWPITGGHVPTYSLSGPRVWTQERGIEPPDEADNSVTQWETVYPYEWDVQQHMNTAGFLLVAREVFSRIRWRWDADHGMTDDPCFEQDAREFLGYPTYVRHDCIGKHHPESILPIERRFPDRDMGVKS